MKKALIFIVIFAIALVGCQLIEPKPKYEELPFTFEDVIPPPSESEDAIAFAQRVEGTNDTLVTVVLGYDRQGLPKTAELGFVPKYVLMKDVVEDNSLRLKESILTIVNKDNESVSIMVENKLGYNVIELKNEEKRKTMTKIGVLYIAYQSREVDQILIKNLG